MSLRTWDTMILFCNDQKYFACWMSGSAWMGKSLQLLEYCTANVTSYVEGSLDENRAFFPLKLSRYI